MVGEFGRAVRHLVWAIAVIALGALSALGVALDAQGSGALAGIGLPGWIVSVVAIVAATIIAAGKLAEMSFKVERLERERDETTFREAPIIGWTDVHAECEPNNNIYVETWCENTGPTESVATYLSAAFVCRLHPEEELVIVSPLTRWHPIKSHKLGNEHKFKVQVVSQSPLSPGTHEIHWVMFYSDRMRPTIGYVTHASFVADFQAQRNVPIREDMLFTDASSLPLLRHERYLSRREANDPFGFTVDAQ